MVQEILMLTPNGRFELNKKICLTITGYHEEHWQPAWGIRTALIALIGFFESEARGAIGGIDMSQADRQRLARASPAWTCPICKQPNSELLPEPAKAEPSAALLPEPGKDEHSAAAVEATPVTAAPDPAPPAVAPPPASATPPMPRLAESLRAEVQSALDAHTVLPQLHNRAVEPGPVQPAPAPAPVPAPLPPQRLVAQPAIPAPAPAAPRLAARAIPPPGAVILVAEAAAPGQVAIPASVAPSLTPSPPTLMDRFILAMLVLGVGLAIRTIN